jgi:hypothetical protein
MQLDLLVKDPVVRGGLALFPVFSTSPSASLYLTGPDADAAQALAIGEHDDHEVVEELVVHNGAAHPVLLVEGETLVGAWQNRTLNVSVLVGAGATLAVPVSCIEAGRWHDSGEMNRSGRHTPTDLRRLKSSSVNRAHALGYGHASDQHAVWQRISSYHTDLAAFAPTRALDDVYSVVEPDLDAMTDGLVPFPDQRGVVVAIGGAVRGLDMFDKPSTLASYWDSLVAGYAIDALRAPSQTPSLDDAEQFAVRVVTAADSPAPAVGLGREHLLAGAGVTGQALEWDGGVVHLAAFTT